MSKSEIAERCYELRNDKDTHYNCAQAVFIPFAEKKGIPAEQAAAITANFGSGMRMGATCGAITGGLMVLGLYGRGGAADSSEFIRRMRERHEGRTQCKDLLAQEVHSAEEKKAHCDGMVYEAVEIVEDMLQKDEG